MKEVWLMICSGLLLDRCLASSRDEAREVFRRRNSYSNWSESDVLSEADYMNELMLNSFENS